VAEGTVEFVFAGDKSDGSIDHPSLPFVDIVPVLPGSIDHTPRLIKYETEKMFEH